MIYRSHKTPDMKEEKENRKFISAKEEGEMGQQCREDDVFHLTSKEERIKMVVQKRRSRRHGKGSFYCAELASEDIPTWACVCCRVSFNSCCDNILEGVEVVPNYMASTQLISSWAS